MKRVKVLLLNPPCEDMITTELPLLINKNLGNLPQLGLLYLVSSLKRHSDEIELKFLDSLEAKINYKRLSRYVKSYKPDIVGILAITHNILTVSKVVKIIKKISLHTHVNLGGPHVTLFPQEALGLNGVDSITVGDGEEAFTELVLDFKRKENLNEIKGVYFKNKNPVEYAPAVIDDLDKIEFPARDLMLGKKYSYRLSGKRRIATMVSSRGCPFHCSFCLVPNFKFRKRSVDNVLKEIDACIRLGFEEIYFVDDTFNTDIQWVQEFISQIKSCNISWSFRGRVNVVTDALVRDLRESGCVRIHFGVEASSDKGLDSLNKNANIEDITNAFKLCKKHGIETVAYFLIGTPYEKSKVQVLDTIDFALKLDPDYCMFNILAIYPKTKLYFDAVDKKIIPSKYWQDFITYPSKDFKLPFWEENLSRKELQQLVRLAYKRFYFRIAIIKKGLRLFWKRNL
ncbi:MAG: radical SAM protein [Candidatus Saelkia tenebricola]|nr:radical SAM protein [Candidatus Saelkia tenebricola]